MNVFVSVFEEVKQKYVIHFFVYIGETWQQLLQYLFLFIINISRTKWITVHTTYISEVFFFNGRLSEKYWQAPNTTLLYKFKNSIIWAQLNKHCSISSFSERYLKPQLIFWKNFFLASAKIQNSLEGVSQKDKETLFKQGRKDAISN